MALSIFNAAVRTPLNIAAAFWRPWFTDDGNKKVRSPQDAEGQEVEISLPKTEINSQQSHNQRQCRRKSLTAPSASAKHRSHQ